MTRLSNMLAGCCLVRADDRGIHLEALRFIPLRLTLAEDCSLLTHFCTGSNAPAVQQPSRASDHQREQHHGKAA